jgi:hypothetical protein
MTAGVGAAGVRHELVGEALGVGREKPMRIPRDRRPAADGRSALDRQKARDHYAALVKLSEHADAERPELREARAALAR